MSMRAYPRASCGTVVGAALAVSIALAPGIAGAEQQASVEVGKAIYGQTCVACHGEDGTGTIPGTPEFTRPDGVLSKPDEVLLRHVKEGFKSPGSQMAMPPRGGNPDLSDGDLESVLQYIKQAFAEGSESG